MSIFEKKVFELIKPQTKEYFDKLKINYKDEVLYKKVAEILDIGVSVIEHVQTDKDIEFVKIEFTKLANNFDSALTSLNEAMENNLTKLLKATFDTNDDNSEVRGMFKMFTEMLNSSREVVKEQVKEMLLNASKISTDKLISIEEGIKNAEDKFNPDLDGSYLAKVKSTIKDFENNIDKKLDPSNTNSFTYSVNEHAAKLFGNDSPILIEFRNIAKDYIEEVREEVSKLREEIARKEGELDAMKKTAVKGFTFENQVEELLQRYSNIFGEVFVNTSKISVLGSKKGDFIHEYKNGERVVIDAKYTNSGLKPSLLYLDDAMKTRGCSFGIIVVQNISQLPKGSFGFGFYEGNKILTTFDFLQYALQYVRLVGDNNKSNITEINSSILEKGLETLRNIAKNYTVLKTKLTKISNGVSSGIDDIKKILLGMENDMSDIFLTMENELNKE